MSPSRSILCRQALHQLRAHAFVLEDRKEGSEGDACCLQSSATTAHQQSKSVKCHEILPKKRIPCASRGRSPHAQPNPLQQKTINEVEYGAPLHAAPAASLGSASPPWLTPVPCRLVLALTWPCIACPPPPIWVCFSDAAAIEACERLADDSVVADKDKLRGKHGRLAF